MLVKVEYNDGSETTKRHFSSKTEAYEYFNSICHIHKVVTVSITPRLLYARCESKELKGLSDALRH